ncbi:cryptochrome-1b [Phyllopteryx taeniolatus]|uniref:cryptochrome-1b n=1 Tax=Phyllopteryx taeniolatus TaxID=161469 RepID=UPI002AD2C6EE|nr:cryptochrome-1b [Phyllopteryx taeniolatus]
MALHRDEEKFSICLDGDLPGATVTSRGTERHFNTAEVPIGFRCSTFAIVCAHLPTSTWLRPLIRLQRYLPIVSGFPAKYIHDPWNAPEELQKAAKCAIGVNYPKPMVNHAEASRINIERMKQIYQHIFPATEDYVV